MPSFASCKMKYGENNKGNNKGSNTRVSIVTFNDKSAMKLPYRNDRDGLGLANVFSGANALFGATRATI